MPLGGTLPNHPPNDTVLAAGTINGDELVVQLVRQRMPTAERTLKPSVVRIIWPLQPTIVDVKAFPDAAAMLTRLFASAAIELAGIKARLGTPL
jgi:hypothetical protein